MGVLAAQSLLSPFIFFMKPEKIIDSYKASILQSDKDKFANQLMLMIIRTPVCKKWRFVLNDLPDEEWKVIDGIDEKCEISNYGRLKRCASYRYHSVYKKDILYTEKICEFNQRVDNYARTSFLINGENKSLNIHVLVGTYFLEPIEGKDWINHKDGNKRNNYYLNLEWSTYEENNKHARDTGLNVHKNENHFAAKVTNKKVLEIFNSPLSNLELSVKYNIKPSTISCIKRGKTWSNITGKQYKRKNKVRGQKAQ